MKKILYLALFLICGQPSYAQNYQCLQYGPVNYFLNGNGYIRAIRIDSIRASGSDTVFYPYRTQRGTYYGCLQSVTVDNNGASWLGKNVIKQADGTFLFDNMWNDTVIIKTQANLGDSWSFFNDTTYESYKATVTSVDTMTILGVMDSIKKITIEADSSGLVNPLDPVNGFQIILSKNNGFVQVFDLYTFPYHRPDTIYQYREFFDWHLDVLLGNLGIGDLGCFEAMNSPDTINSVFHRVAFHNPTLLEIYDFAVGDVYEYSDLNNGTYGYHNIIAVDSVISKVTNPHSVSYEIAEQQYITDLNTLGVTTYSSAHHTLLVNADTSRLFNFYLLPEELTSSELYYYFHDSTILAADSGFIACSADVYLDGTVQLQYDGTSTYPGYSTQSYGIGYGQTGILTQNYTAYNFRTKSYGYVIKSGNICGNYSRLIAGIKNVNVINTELSIFPNPAHDKLNINSTGSIREVTIGNIVGQILFTGTYDQDNVQIDVSTLPAGVYYVKINGSTTKKFVKE